MSSDPLDNLPDDVPSADELTKKLSLRKEKGDEDVVEVPLETDPQPTASSQRPVMERDQTVISKKPPVAARPLSGAGPFDLGRALEGERLGHFELGEFVGGGGMGAVFRARDTMLGRIVAVKVLAKDHGSDEETVRRFKNEAQSAARLDHENIARVFYVGKDSGWNYIVFEFIDGINIRDLVEQKGPLPLDEAVSYTLQVAEALTHASERDVVHRDIKPSNILVTPEGRAKLVDMGLARLHQVESTQDDLTASGVTLGTFDYISPEQARDPRGTDVRGDLYSLGCTLFYILTGRAPFPEGTVLQKLLSHSTDPPPDPRDSRPDLPEELVTILHTLLAKRPDDRYQEPAVLIGALLMLSEHQGLNVGDRGSVWVTPGTSRFELVEQHVSWVAPVMMLLAIVGIMQFSFSWNNEPEPVFGFAAFSEMETIAPAPTTVPDEESDTVPGPDAPVEEATTPSDETPEEGSTSPVPVEPPATPDEPVVPKTAPADEGEEPATSTGDSTPEASETEEPASTGQSGTDKEANLRVFVVGDDDTSPFERSGALDLVADADVIELHYDGVRNERPFRLSLSEGQTLTIRAGEGFSPVIRFAPEVGAEATHPKDMITIGGGQVSFESIHLEMDIPVDPPANDWALLKMDQMEKLALTNCTLTVRNASQTLRSGLYAASFINVQGAKPPTTPVTVEGGGIAVPRTSVVLKNCLARGEATLVHADEATPLSLTWDNGLLITSERMLLVGGTEVPSLRSEFIRLDLQNVTAIVDKGLCRLVSEGDEVQLTLDAHCHQSIVTTRDGMPLFEMLGEGSLAEHKKKLAFNGDDAPAGRNYYPGVETFWRIESEQGGVQQYGWDAWDERFSDPLSSPLAVKWKGADDEPISDQVRSLYRIDPESSAGLLKVGFREEKDLPRFPEPKLPAFDTLGTSE